MQEEEDKDKEKDEDEEDADGWMVPHGYLSDDEGIDNEEDVSFHLSHLTDLLAQSVAHLTANPGVSSSILAWSHTFVDTDHEIISTVILLLALIQEGMLSVTSESMCMKYWLTA